MVSDGPETVRAQSPVVAQANGQPQSIGLFRPQDGRQRAMGWATRKNQSPAVQSVYADVRRRYLQKVRPLRQIEHEEERAVDRDYAIRFNIASTSEPLTTSQRTLLERFDLPDIDDADELLRQKHLAQRAIGLAFTEAQFTLEDLFPYRLRAAWRIVREWVRTKGLIQYDETLSEALEPPHEDFDPWIIPEAYKQPGNYVNYSRDINRDALQILLEAEALPEEFWFSRVNNAGAVTIHTGLPVLPPPVPLDWHDSLGDVSEGYDPDEDTLLRSYIRAIRSIAQGLYIDQGSKNDPDQGRYGLVGLFDPHLIRLAFPSRMAIIVYEEMMIQETLDLVIEFGVPEAKRRLKNKYGLQPVELMSLMKMSRVLAQRQMEGDVEEDRSIMLMRLEDYCNRARNALDLRSELSGLKQMSIIMGLAQSHENDPVHEFIDVVRRVSQERRTAMLEEQSVQVKRIESVVTESR